ncbi:hypothetical protein CHELA1G11_12244 [Hyphomicrobiales bacterium]|nr:hypothetical protein CHELA1G2_12067 [Hyphomicrobiales bacterium]CAH1663487.1 hypothetical protein CHELA1G11_12244 [Hyphomicrobiales bacterium]
MKPLKAGNDEILGIVFAKIEVEKDYFMDGSGRDVPTHGGASVFSSSILCGDLRSLKETGRG